MDISDTLKHDTILICIHGIAATLYIKCRSLGETGVQNYFEMS